ncbi:efflux RND transporter periplasmic adaptor subunit [Stieleria sp. TO1_6]|uniref:efflux RND transporter periplasmic adaptor subunit n=1 Tax=Stieleria tagensis TaxID=2956795 RepID=UPI00209AC2A0|nr:HlyD family efflux transporter periplasmic adaptor subunit [Stieleria tagensis]MCO8120400.1 efflux RND transporter periplasmic adaptor subunit [Stieleria tagensis]
MNRNLDALTSDAAKILNLHLYSSLIAGLVLACCCQSTHGEDIEADSVLIRLIDQVDVPARAIGSLIEIDADEGAVVKKGDLLARIDDTEAELERQRAKYEHAIASHEANDDVAIRSATKAGIYAQAHYQRLSRADQAQPRSVSESELEKARLDAEQAALELELAKRKLEQADIRKNLTANDLALAERNVDVRKIFAPLSGVVVNVLHHPGEWVKPGEQIFRIVRTDRLRAEGFVRASDVVEDLRGKPVTVTPDLGDKLSQRYSGKIVFVSPEIDPVNGQVRVWAEVENPQGHLRPGLRAKMTIATD